MNKPQTEAPRFFNPTSAGKIVYFSPIILPDQSPHLKSAKTTHNSPCDGSDDEELDLELLEYFEIPPEQFMSIHNDPSSQKERHQIPRDIARPRADPPNHRQRFSSSFYFLGWSAILFAWVALVAFCWAINLLLAPTVVMGPLAALVGALFIKTTAFYLALGYATTAAFSGLIAISLFKARDRATAQMSERNHKLKYSVIDAVKPPQTAYGR